MIDPQDRLLSEGQGYFGPRENPATQTHCNVWDWDQLRLIKVKGTAKLFPPQEDVETSILAQFADYLSPEVRAITVDDDGLLTGVSTDRKKMIQAFWISPLITLSITRRLPYRVDLVSYNDQRVAFKFNPLDKPRRLKMSWKETNLLSKLPPHPNLILFDRIVLEDVESRVIGFTTKYIPGGMLADDPKRPFRFEWLQQLTQLVDFLNLELGIMHQDIAPRNLLIDPDTDKIILFDFDWAANGKEGLMDGRDDVSGVVFTLHEIITNDTHPTSIPHWERNTDMVQNIEWTCRRELDSDVSKFRNFLDEWIASRTEKATEQHLNAPKRLTWPDLPTPPDYSVPFELGWTEEGETVWQTGGRSRRIALEKGQYCFRWQRPPQSRKKAESING
ncbi:uncharacterized protein N7515_002443 [Penicillium bovifimosum]|uniref:EKC/KEOPS complex subunit BUD32 n=1 Tax=Penicillium bovifimosum TaxID=126998 RepID=A0A9W9L9D4_9EURO|nr:uncharacterized protein N7515_002443 [Penicillium bovifimosum]KAJ5143656.1 hypothetical protein N7515_002443 [Penicillium bovifimosum]